YVVLGEHRLGQAEDLSVAVDIAGRLPALPGSRGFDPAEVRHVRVQVRDAVLALPKRHGNTEFGRRLAAGLTVRATALDGTALYVGLRHDPGSVSTAVLVPDFVPDTALDERGTPPGQAEAFPSDLLKFMTHTVYQRTVHAVSGRVPVDALRRLLV